MIVKETGGSFERVPTGVFQAVCAQYYDIGIQPGFDGKQKHELVILWEIEERKTEGDYKGQRFQVSKRYTASLNEKATLRKDLESWRGRPFSKEELEGFDMDNILGINCMLNLVESTSQAGKTFTKIAAVMPIRKGTELMVPEVEKGYMPAWIKAVLGIDQEDAQDNSNGGFESDIPF